MLAFSRAGEQALPPTVASAIMVRRGGTRTRQYGVDGLDQTFDQQIVQNYDNFTSLTFGGGPNPNFGQPTSQILAGPQFQTPRQIRVGARFTF